LQSFQIKVKF